MRLDHLLSKENVEAGEIRASVVRRKGSSKSLLFNFQGSWSLKSRCLIPEGPPVPIPNTEVKLRRAEDTLPATARENRSAPTPFRDLQRFRKGNKGFPQDGGVAQLGEHLPCKQGVMGSNPIISTRVDTAEDHMGL